MRGDQLARQWRVIRAIEASANGLSVAELAEREETGIRTIYRDLEALQAAGFPLYNERVERSNRWAFIDTFKFKIPPPFTHNKLMSFVPCPGSRVCRRGLAGQRQEKLGGIIKLSRTKMRPENAPHNPE